MARAKARSFPKVSPVVAVDVLALLRRSIAEFLQEHSGLDSYTSLANVAAASSLPLQIQALQALKADMRCPENDAEAEKLTSTATALLRLLLEPQASPLHKSAAAAVEKAVSTGGASVGAALEATMWAFAARLGSEANPEDGDGKVFLEPDLSGRRMRALVVAAQLPLRASGALFNAYVRCTGEFLARHAAALQSDDASTSFRPAAGQVDACAVTLTTCIELLSRNRSWIVPAQQPPAIDGNDGAADFILRMCESCQTVLAAPIERPEMIAQAARVLVLLCRAWWRGQGLWPAATTADTSEMEPGAAAEGSGSEVSPDGNSASVVRSTPFSAGAADAAALVWAVLLSDADGGGELKDGGGELKGGGGDGVREDLLCRRLQRHEGAALPLRSRLALCRAVASVMEGAVLVAVFEPPQRSPTLLPPRPRQEGADVLPDASSIPDAVIGNALIANGDAGAGTDTAVTKERHPSSHNGATLIGCLLPALLLRHCDDSSAPVRVAALAGLQAWTAAALALLQAQAAPPKRHSPLLSAAERLGIAQVALDVIEMILHAWDRPVRREWGLTTALFRQAVALRAAAVAAVAVAPTATALEAAGGDCATAAVAASSALENGTADGGSSGGGEDDCWGPILARVLAESPERKGRYAALAALLPAVGGGVARLLALRPDLVPQLVAAVGAKQNVASYAVPVLVAVVQQVGGAKEGRSNSAGSGGSDGGGGGAEAGSEAAKTGPQAETTKAEQIPEAAADAAAAVGPLEVIAAVVVDALTCADPRTRMRVADYLLPAVIKADWRLSPILSALLRGLTAAATATAAAPTAAAARAAAAAPRLSVLTAEVMPALSAAAEADGGEADDGGLSVADTRLWALVEVARRTREVLGVGDVQQVVSPPPRLQEPAAAKAMRPAGIGGACDREGEAGGDKGGGGGGGRWLVTSAEVAAAALHHDGLVRCAAVVLLCRGGGKSTALPPPHELLLLQQVLPFCLHADVAEHRHRIVKSLQVLLERLRDGSRAVAKEIAFQQKGTAVAAATAAVATAAKAARANNGVLLPKQPTPYDRQPGSKQQHRHQPLRPLAGRSLQELQRTASLLSEFVSGLCCLLRSGLYPGCSAAREIMYLEALESVFAALFPLSQPLADGPAAAAVPGKAASRDTGGGGGGSSDERAVLALPAESGCPLAARAAAVIFSAEGAGVLLALCNSPWNRTRSLAASLLTRFPPSITAHGGGRGTDSAALSDGPDDDGGDGACVGGAGGATSALRQVAWGLCAAGSAHQKSASSGALVLRLVCTTCCAGLGWTILIKCAATSSGGSSGAGKLRFAAATALKGSVVSATVDGCALSVSLPAGRSVVCPEAAGCAGSAVRLFVSGLCDVLEDRLLGLERALVVLLQRAGIGGSSGGSGCGGDGGGGGDGSGPADSGDGLKDVDTAATSKPVLSAVALPAVHGLFLTMSQLLGEVDFAAVQQNGRAAVSTTLSVSAAVPATESALAETRLVVPPLTAPAASSAEVLEAWRHVLERALSVAFRAIELSLTVLGASEVDAMEGNEGQGEDGSTRGGDVGNGGDGRGDASMYKSVGATTLDCRGHLILPGHDAEGAGGDDGDGGDGNGGDGDGGGGTSEGERAVVGTWLMFREAVAGLASLMTRTPVTELGRGRGGGASGNGGVGGDGSEWQANETTASPGEVLVAPLLSVEQAADAGALLLRALLSLRHMGAVAAAQASFQAVCEVLLRGGGSGGIGGLCTLPERWLESLLRRLVDTRQQFVLRRSSGFAYAFLALLKAEPRDRVPVLLPRAIPFLLALAARAPAPLETCRTPSDTTEAAGPAGDDHACNGVSSGSGDGDGGISAGGGGWQGQVHALNILRLCFLDSVLAEDMAGAYRTDAFEAAVRGFEDRAWAVRNSSLLLFAALVRRTVGSRRGSFGPRAVATAQALFRSCPQLQAFLLARLKVAAAVTTEHEHGGGGGKDHGEHPALHPVLVLLSSLRPIAFSESTVEKEAAAGDDAATASGGAGSGGDAAASDGAPHNVAAEPAAGMGVATIPLASAPDEEAWVVPFFPLLVAAGRSSPNALSRATAARALAALVPVESAASHAVALIRFLPATATAAAWGASKPGGASDRSTSTLALRTCNALQGTLLQVRELLESARGTVAAASGSLAASFRGSGSQSKIWGELAFALLARLRLGMPESMPCPPVRHALMDALVSLAACVTGAGPEIIRPVDDACFAVIAANAAHGAAAGTENLPGQALLTVAAVRAFVSEELQRASMLDATPLSPLPPLSGGSAATAGGCHEGTVAKPAAAWILPAGIQAALDFVGSPRCDVRDAAVKALKKVVGPAGRRRGEASGGGGGQGSFRLARRYLVAVYAAGARALLAESHPPSIRRLLRLLRWTLVRMDGRLNSGGSGGGDAVEANSAPSAEVLNAHILRLCSGAPARRRLYADGLELLGWHARAAAAAAATAAAAGLASTEMVAGGDDWLALVESACIAGRVVQERYAAARAVSASGVLIATDSVAEEAAVAATPTLSAVRAWLVVVRLLQDDDLVVRDLACRICAASLPPPSGGIWGAGNCDDGSGGASGDGDFAVVMNPLAARKRPGSVPLRAIEAVMETISTQLLTAPAAAAVAGDLAPAVAEKQRGALLVWTAGLLDFVAEGAAGALAELRCHCGTLLGSGASADGSEAAAATAAVAATAAEMPLADGHTTTSAAADRTGSGSSSGAALFAMDPSNEHAEPVLIAWLVARHTPRLLAACAMDGTSFTATAATAAVPEAGAEGRRSHNAAATVETWVERLCGGLLSTATVTLDLLRAAADGGAGDWAGSHVTYQPQVFPAAYCALVGGCVAAAAPAVAAAVSPALSATVSSACSAASLPFSAELSQAAEALAGKAREMCAGADDRLARWHPKVAEVLRCLAQCGDGAGSKARDLSFSPFF